MMIPNLMAVAAGLATTALIAAPAASLPAREGQAPTRVRAAATAVSLTGIGFVQQVSSDGSWLRGLADGDQSTYYYLDRTTGASTLIPHGDTQPPVGFVRDNPMLRLEPQASAGNYYVYTGLWLANITTGARVRIDVDAAGTALFPEWMTGLGTYKPRIAVSAASVTADGRLVAMCVDDAFGGPAHLAIKDLTTAALTRTAVTCGASNVRGLLPPTISEDGSVVHVSGEVDEEAEDGNKAYDYVYPDRLVFPGAGMAVRELPGWGSMTRDGSTVFLMKGVRPVGAPAPKWKYVTWNVATGKYKKIPAKYGGQFYGHTPSTFSAVDMSSRRGRYVVLGHGTVKVLDRQKGKLRNLAPAMAAAGYPAYSYQLPYISADGKVVLALTAWPSSPNLGRTYVAVTGWR